MIPQQAAIPAAPHRTPPGRAAVAVLAYAAAVALLVQLAWGAVADLVARQAAVAAAADILDRLEGRRAAPLASAGMPAGLRRGSPFLEGPTVTVAGAGLMQRVSEAVARFDGRILSSRVELQGTPLGAGFLGVTTNLEIGQADFQALLYEIEAGLPFLFVDQLVAQAPATAAEAQDGRLRVLMTVYGQWQGAR